MDAGDHVQVVFWRPWALHGMPNNGTWEQVPARVVSVRQDRALACVALDNPNLPAWFGGDAVGDLLRFLPLSEIFATHEDAAAALAQRPAKT